VAQNVQVARDLFAGERSAVRDAVVLNAAAGLAAHAGLSDDLTADLTAGIRRAQDALDSGAAAQVLDRWIALGRELAAAPH
jgi:anthranilate phosphoribosyltransferase